MVSIFSTGLCDSNLYFVEIEFKYLLLSSFSDVEINDYSRGKSVEILDIDIVDLFSRVYIEIYFVR